MRADFLKNHSNSIVVVKEPCSGGSDDESVLILDVYEISGLGLQFKYGCRIKEATVAYYLEVEILFARV